MKKLDKLGIRDVAEEEEEKGGAVTQGLFLSFMLWHSRYIQ